MKRSLRFAMVAAACLALASTAGAQDAPTFSLFFGGCGDDARSTVGGAPFEATYNCMLATSGNPSDVDGAQGWSISLTAGGAVELTGITTAGAAGAELASGGFEKTEVTLTDRNQADCAGAPGAVSAVVLSFTQPITLPADGMIAIARATVAGTFPPAPEEGSEEPNCESASLSYVDNCRGSGQPVENNITWRGQTVKPELGSCEFNLCTDPIPPCPFPDPEAPYQIIIQSEPSIGEGGKAQIVGDNLAGLLTPVKGDPCPVRGPDDQGEAIICKEVAADTESSVSVYLAIGSNGEAGVQGWSISVASSGDLALTGATTAGTAGGTGAAGLQAGGFEKTETVDPTKNDQGEGAVSAVVLSFTQPITLAPVGTATILCLELTGSVAEGESKTATIEGRDGLQGAGQPVQSVATVEGATEDFSGFQIAKVTLKPTSEIGPFRRCDPNNDGRNNLADAIWIVNELFRGGQAAVCEIASDCDSNDRVDLNDAIFAVNYQFLGGDAPGAPFPDCDVTAPVPDGLECENTSACPSEG